MAGSEKRQRNKSLLIRLTDEERETLENRAQESGLSIGAFVRKASLGSAGPRVRRAATADADELRRLRGQLGQVGNNVNQIAHRLNAREHVAGSEFHAVLEELREIVPLLRKALGHDH